MIKDSRELQKTAKLMQDAHGKKHRNGPTVGGVLLWTVLVVYGLCVWWWGWGCYYQKTTINGKGGSFYTNIPFEIILITLASHASHARNVIILITMAFSILTDVFSRLFVTVNRNQNRELLLKKRSEEETVPPRCVRCVDVTIDDRSLVVPGMQI